MIFIFAPYIILKKSAPKFLVWLRLGLRRRSHRRKEMFEALNNLRMILKKSRALICEKLTAGGFRNRFKRNSLCKGNLP